jgi:hypothetical protein
MRNLPVPVADDDIDQMFDYADTDKDGRLSYKEFQVSLIQRQDKFNHDEQKQHVLVVVVRSSSYRTKRSSALS